MSQLVPARFLFHFELPVQRLATAPVSGKPLPGLSGDYQLPGLGELERLSEFAEVRLGWHERGLAVQVGMRKAATTANRGGSVAGVGATTLPVGRAADSHANARTIELWIDTRNTRNVHRATKYCHRYRVTLADPQTSSHGQPTVIGEPIPQARENVPVADHKGVRVEQESDDHGLSVRIWFPADRLNGFDPAENPRLGFFYRVRDPLHGEQTLSAARGLPIEQDPSIWQTLALQASESR